MRSHARKLVKVAGKKQRASRAEGVRRGAAPLSYAGAYLASPIERIESIRKGIPAALLVETGEAMEVPRERLYSILHLPSATVKRKISTKGLLSPEISERVLGLRKLIGQVEVMVRESGEPEGFSAAKWTAWWLNEPSPALGGHKPADFMDTVEGQVLVSSLVARMQSGAYS